MNSGPWSIACGNFADRERAVQVLVRGSEVVIVAPAGEIARLGPAAAVQFRTAVDNATEVANAPAPGAPGRRLMEIGAASTAEQDRDEMPPAVAGQVAPLSCRGGTGSLASGPAAIVAAVGGGG
jgi:hypothetical protein